MLKAGDPVAEIHCSWCGGSMTAVISNSSGNLVKARCNNTLPNGKPCGSWTTGSGNASFLMKREKIAELERLAANDNTPKDDSAPRKVETAPEIVEEDRNEEVDAGPDPANDRGSAKGGILARRRARKRQPT